MAFLLSSVWSQSSINPDLLGGNLFSSQYHNKHHLCTWVATCFIRKARTSYSHCIWKFSLESGLVGAWWAVWDIERFR